MLHPQLLLGLQSEMSRFKWIYKYRYKYRYNYIYKYRFKYRIDNTRPICCIHSCSWVDNQKGQGTLCDREASEELASKVFFLYIFGFFLSDILPKMGNLQQISLLSLCWQNFIESLRLDWKYSFPSKFISTQHCSNISISMRWTRRLDYFQYSQGWRQ